MHHLYFVVFLQAAGRHESLANLNLEKKAKWKEELDKKEETVSLAPKAQ